MAEQGEGTKQEVIKKPGVISRRNLLRGAGAVAGLAMAGVSQGVRSVAAEGTPTPTPTPDALDIKIAAADATITALGKERILAQRGVTQTAIVEDIEGIKNPKTATPTATVTATTTPTATPTFTNEQIDIKKRAGIWPSTTPTSTATAKAVPAITATFVPEGSGDNSSNQQGRIPVIGDVFKEKGLPVTEVVSGAVAAAVIGIANIFRPVRNFEGRIIRGIAGLPGWAGAFIGRRRGGGGGGTGGAGGTGAAPGGGTPPAGGAGS